MSKEKIDQLFSLVDIDSLDSIIDFGGGNGEVLVNILSKGKTLGILVDTNSALLEDCMIKYADLISRGKLEVINQDARGYLKTQTLASIDCAICIGSSHAFDNYKSFISEIKPYLKPSGLVIVGEGFWKQRPDEAYLKILGSAESDLMYHHENIEAAENLGLKYLFSNVASEDDWNIWEGRYFLDKELEHSKDGSAESLKAIEEIREFRRAQIKFGRETMGFGLYLMVNQV